MRRSLALTVVVLAFAANAFAVGQARLSGKIVDAVTKKPIADAVVTVKAVEWHLGNAYRKLEVRGRSDLPHVLGSPGVPP